jgi:ADP-ribosylglycohydrolase
MQGSAMTPEKLSIPFEDYRRKVLGCWLGKAVGGTLGGPHEGKPGPLDLTFYDPVPERMEGNDDLDLQVVWLHAVRRRGLPVDRLMLSEVWRDCVQTCPDEYGVCLRNMAHHLMPSLSGAYDNGFTDGMGAAIRSEIWACLAPGDPELAAKLAREDACVDHAGDGIHAETFFVTIESAAFVESDPAKLIEMGLAAIPADSRVDRAVRAAVDGWHETGDWRRVRETLMGEHATQNFTDVPINLAFTVLGWLAGEGDFGRAICTAVNCGQDTDCTGATLGAILGLIDPDCIGDEWLTPIGRRLVLSPFVTAMAAPATLDELTDQTADLAQQVLRYYGSSVELAGAPAVRHPVRHRIPAAVGAPQSLRRPANPRVALVASEPVALAVRYPQAVRVAPGQTARLQVEAANATERPVTVELCAAAPDGWAVEIRDGRGAELGPREVACFALAATPSEAPWRPYASRLDLLVSIDGRVQTHTTGLLMAIPLLHWPLAAVPDECPAPADAEVLEANGHFIELAGLAPAGECHAFCVEFKMPYAARVRFVTQASRPMRVWLGEERINDLPGGLEVPAIHRAGPTGADRQLGRGAYRLTMAVGPAAGEAGRLFFAMGDPGRWSWLETTEFRLPRN